LQPGSSRIWPIIASRRSRIFGRRCLTVNIHLYSLEMTVSSYRRSLVKKRLAGMDGEVAVYGPDEIAVFRCAAPGLDVLA
jgi:hypothetical protein